MSTFVFKVIRRALMRAFRQKRPEIELETIFIHYHNAPLHRAVLTSMDIDFLGFERLEHSQYSPDLALINFQIFLRLKKELMGIHTDMNLNSTCRMWLEALTDSCTVPCLTNG